MVGLAAERVDGRLAASSRPQTMVIAAGACSPNVNGAIACACTSRWLRLGLVLLLGGRRPPTAP
eukprot:12920883-Prorocentrum_lima.AAC.1